MDQSTSYTLGATHDISEFSIASTADNGRSSPLGGMGDKLRRGLPMNVDSEDTDEDDDSHCLHHRYGGYGYDHGPPLQSSREGVMTYHNNNNPAYIPSTFPSSWIPRRT